MAEIHLHPVLLGSRRKDEGQRQFLERTRQASLKLMRGSVNLAAELMQLQIELLNRAEDRQDVEHSVIVRNFEVLVVAHRNIKDQVDGDPTAQALMQGLDDDLRRLRKRLTTPNSEGAGK